MTACLNCVPGKYAAVEASAKCSKCPRGWLQQLSEQADCSRPKAGSIVGNGASTEVTIAEGWHASNCTADGCLKSEPCPPGTIGTEPPSEECELCPPGETSFKGSLDCQECEKGKFAATQGAPRCELCDKEKGEYADTAASITCSMCPKGKVSTGTDACLAAPLDEDLPVLQDVRVKTAVESVAGAGPLNHSHVNITWPPFTVEGSPSEVTSVMIEWSNDLEFPADRSDSIVIAMEDAPLRKEHGSLIIDLESQFPPLIASVLYVRLRTLSQDGTAGEWSIPNGKWQVKQDCLPTQYLDASIYTNRSWDPTTFQCQPCPVGASCHGDIAWSGVMAKFGFWRVPGALPNEFASCPFPGACLGAKNLKLEGTYYNKSWENGQWVEFNFDYAKHRLNEECNTYYGFKPGSRLCHTCKDEFRRLGLDRCSSCPTQGQNFGLLILAVLLLVAGGVIVVWMAIKDAGKAEQSEIIRKLPFNFLQVSALAAGFPLHWPPALEGLFDFQGAISTAGEHILNPDCSVRGVSAADLFFAKQIGYAFTPIALTLIIYVYWRVHAMCRGIPWSDRVTVETHTTKDMMIVTICVLLYFFWPTSLKQAFSMFSCRTVGSTSGELFLMAE